jgi:hypothetical protein
MRQRPEILPMTAPRRKGASTGDRLQVAFALAVLAFFAAQLLRGLIQHGLLG